MELPIGRKRGVIACLRDDVNFSRFLGVDDWQSAAEYSNFFETAKAEGKLQPVEDLLLSPPEVEILDTVKYSRNRRH